MFMCGLHNGVIIIAFKFLFTRRVTQARDRCPDGPHEPLLSCLSPALRCWSDKITQNGDAAGNVNLTVEMNLL